MAGIFYCGKLLVNAYVEYYTGGVTSFNGMAGGEKCRLQVFRLKTLNPSGI